MTDISMCTQTECPKFSSCYRAQAKPSDHRQSYMSPSFEESGCRHYWPIKKPDKTEINKE